MVKQYEDNIEMIGLNPLFALPGGPEMLIIVVIFIFLFGANKLPKLARSTGQAQGEFKKGREKMEQELKEMRGELDETDSDESESSISNSSSDTNEPMTEKDHHSN